MKTLGIILLILGVMMTVVTGFTIVTQKKVVDAGPIQIDKKEKTPIYWSPITGGIMAVAGLFVVLAGRKNEKF